jgi:hypothetical protein
VVLPEDRLVHEVELLRLAVVIFIKSYWGELAKTVEASKM